MYYGVPNRGKVCLFSEKRNKVIKESIERVKITRYIITEHRNKQTRFIIDIVTYVLGRYISPINCVEQF